LLIEAGLRNSDKADLPDGAEKAHTDSISKKDFNGEAHQTWKIIQVKFLYYSYINGNLRRKRNRSKMSFRYYSISFAKALFN
jgi:hypothetical protein